MLQHNHVNGQSGTNGNGRDPRLIEGVISNLPLFRDVGRSHVVLVASYARIEHCRRGALIARQGERLPGVIAVAYGLAKLVLPRRRGEEKVLRFLGANESFGEASALLDRPCPVDVVALADRLGIHDSARVLRQLDEYYQDRSGEDDSVVTALVQRLAEPNPRDSKVTRQLDRYKGLLPRWQEWAAVTAMCNTLAREILQGDL